MRAPLLAAVARFSGTLRIELTQELTVGRKTPAPFDGFRGSGPKKATQNGVSSWVSFGQSTSGAES